MKSSTLATPWSDHSAMLSPTPLHLEMGITRLPDGCLMVCVHNELRGCKGKMLDWWFTFFETTEHIKWWHPYDHIEHKGWDEQWVRGVNYIGATIRAVESLGDIPPVEATLKFHDPRDVFSDPALREAFRREHVSAIICARIGFGADVKLDPNGDPTDGEMIHLVRDTDTGCVLRSRFILGRSCRDPRAEVPDELGLGLLQHCYSEFSYLAAFLPALFLAETRKDASPSLRW